MRATIAAIAAERPFSRSRSALAPAARFAGRLTDLIESGYGLCESGAENVVSLLGEARRPAGRRRKL
ncbi:MAG TPA: hypothetical protein DEV72_06875 [Ktedonobacter sp.]|nr:hypothetical protein [Ktedonobacter sp.]